MPSWEYFRKGEPIFTAAIPFRNLKGILISKIDLTWINRNAATSKGSCSEVNYLPNFFYET